MKKTGLIYFSPIIFFVHSLIADCFTDFAKQWTLQHIYYRDGNLRVSQHELAAIRDLISISAHRAQLTKEAQAASLQMVVDMWRAWQNIAQTRLNPSHERPYTFKRENMLAFDTFWQLLDEQEEACSVYAQIAQKVVHGDVLQTEHAKQAVSEMRTQARVFMLDALTDVKKQLGGLYNIAFNKSINEVDDLIKDENTLFRNRLSIADFVLAYIPNLALHTFVHADKTHNLLSDEGWQVLEKIQCIGNQVWDAIESARFAFYQALLDELA